MFISVDTLLGAHRTDSLEKEKKNQVMLTVMLTVLPLADRTVSLKKGKRNKKN